ncbi:YifB family Mg chelatase-like AAA ATPase [Streptomyces sp. AK02-01A]|uniref:YifB family Mg chelatase-like AAA ATPase n=1 Tax=Streptomyces sp. AK02-01A TaxID=3028648 RepID=UPI0029AE494C|nr:YifB family Mg chelatase-like AAA ATPase [Streptomyces sp. AK02-01A]MDX3854408.1 YifB family Mg chelatase-like AAA ATPase [Streptomyces sp. AK02-01A]
MGFARACSVALVGVEGVVVEVQADLEPGVAAFTLVGLPDKSLVESRDRVRAAVVNSGAEWPQKKLTVGLSPASVPKSGSGFDLAVASAVLGAAERIDPSAIADLVLIGELGLDGRVRPVRGVLPAVLAAAEAGYRQVVVPEQTAGEASLVPGVSVLGVRSLRQLIAVLAGEPVPEEPRELGQGRPDATLAGLMVPGAGVSTGLAGGGRDGGGHRPDLADVAGQAAARTALEVAAAGGHHLLLQGPPGAGKTMLAERLPAVLPPLTRQESLEVTAVHSVAGTLPPGEPLVRAAPYCAPHHSATMQSLVGGGNGLPRPGAVSLAHHGVLFLDEAPEFSGRALDALRQPLESGHVVVARSAGVVRLPARFLMILAANPCPCGRHTLQGAGCECPPSVIRRYQSRLSGPLLDRVDLRVEVRPVHRTDLMGQGGGSESTATVAARVREARARSAARLEGTPWSVNSEVPGHELRTRWLAAPGALAAAEHDLERGMLTARGLDRVLRVAWTAADLAGRDRPEARDVDLALELRTGISRGATAAAGGVS